jgi:hypothetical protein
VTDGVGGGVGGVGATVGDGATVGAAVGLGARVGRGASVTFGVVGAGAVISGDVAPVSAGVVSGSA